ncbi:MAG: hypothetical protein U5L96_22030 [Owenweeksia sp.]|nr:hypothetical protein [Owenweeksia sp.]
MIGELPDDADPPSLGKFDLDELPIMRLGVAANMPATELYDLVDKKVQPQLGENPRSGAGKCFRGASHAKSV